jgi:hypothetical protein
MPIFARQDDGLCVRIAVLDVSVSVVACFGQRRNGFQLGRLGLGRRSGLSVGILGRVLAVGV